MAGRARHWIVVSPVMSAVMPLLDDGSGPIEEWAEVVYVEAATKRDAIVAGVRLMTDWPEQQRGDYMNPYTGVTARDAMCEHGYCWCEINPDPHPGQDDYCEKCIEKDEATP